ncbi:MAG: DUF4129 domain-containing protein [Azoarcus sp.]|jgi:hypothetical protein|nr:DUF4129 domain-containing protein [Azoarcus sp.]
MRLDRIELALRRRSPWEAIDLGLAMVRHWRGPLYRVWLTLVLPVAVLILALLWQWPLAGMLVVWWLKPVADRVLLKFFSEATFGEPPTPREVWRSLTELLDNSCLISRLTVLRFSPYRSFELPMLQLEGQYGKALRQRRQTLSRKVAGHAIYLMQVCVCVVMIFEIAQIQLIGLLIPGDALSDFSLYKWFLGKSNLIDGHLLNLAWLIAESIVEPFYVAGGFSLYLNRRNELEGWDIEVAFRHMAESHASEPARPPKHGVGLMALALLFGAQIVLALPDALAAPASPHAEKAGVAIEGEASRVAREVLSDPVFGHEVEETRWRLRVKEDERPERKTNDLSSQRKLLDLRRAADWLVQSARWVSCLFMAVALAALLVVLYRHASLSRTPRKIAMRAPETLFGLDLRPASLPADPSSAALAEAEAGRFAAALSILYRGALVALIERHQVPFRAGDTENVCLQRLAGHVGEAALGYFSVLLEAWKASAYAGLPPSLASMRVLCQAWREHFGHGGAA